MTDKFHCCVPHCRRWTRRYSAAAEFLCQDHWALLPLRWRRRYTGIKRIADGTSRRQEQAARLCARLWARMKRRAIERAAGI